MKDTTKIVLLLISGTVSLSIGVMATANMYHKIKQERKANAPTEINCVVVQHAYEPDELKCKLNGDIWMFTKEKKNVKAN